MGEPHIIDVDSCPVCGAPHEDMDFVEDAEGRWYGICPNADDTTPYLVWLADVLGPPPLPPEPPSDGD